MCGVTCDGWGDATVGERMRLATGALGAALGLGVLGDALLRVWPWGINVGVWAAGVPLAVAAVAWWAGIRLVGGGRWLTVPLLAFALAIAWRDSSVLLALNLLAVLTCLVLGALYAR